MKNGEKVRIVTLCSGYDSQCLALKYAGIPFDLIAWSEIDKWAIEAHNILFPEFADRNLGDMSKIDWSKVDDFDFLTYSTPCQDISSAGKQRGLEEGSGTRSSLVWYVEECIKTKHPKYLMMENVEALVSHKFMPDFQKWLCRLESYGYDSYWKVLNATKYGIPQNRNRVFVISKLKTADLTPFYFPKPKKLKLFLEDLKMDDDAGEVDESYYLDDKYLEGLEIKDYDKG